MGGSKMPETGSKYIGEVIDLTHDGDGVVRAGDLTVFVSGCLIGDKIEFEIVEMKKNYGIGRLLSILEPSAKRVSYAFDTESLGGGAPLIDLDYKAQLNWKWEKVKKDFERIAGLKLEVRPIIGMGYPFRYRNHTQVPVGIHNGEIVTGYYKKGTNIIVPMTEDYLQPELGDRILSAVRSWMGHHSIEPYDRFSKTGKIKHIGIRINQNNEAMVIIVTTFDKLPELHSLVHKLITETPGVVSIYQNIKPDAGGTTYGRQYRHLFGQEKLIDYIGDLRFEISPNSFFQVNTRQVSILYDTAIKFLEPGSLDTICDIYSGIGTISLYAARFARKVYGIESIRAAVENAKNNAKINGIQNTEFIADRAELAFPDLLRAGDAINKVILDPPRKGCDKKVIDALLLHKPETIVYVSCNPSTLARDTKLLIDGGYEVKAVQPVDMFPHSAHVETVVLMSRIEK
jgi:23S rRNA (uracil1939-C5)-methyltransferase